MGNYSLIRDLEATLAMFLSPLCYIIIDRFSKKKNAHEILKAKMILEIKVATLVARGQLHLPTQSFLCDSVQQFIGEILRLLTLGFLLLL